LNADAPITLIKVDWTPAVFYKTVMSDLSDLADVYDVLAFFSPTGIKSLFMNFPDFEQNNTRIAVLVATQSTRSWFKRCFDILATTAPTNL
jgi:uroporphyrinogen-III synthase